MSKKNFKQQDLVQEDNIIEKENPEIIKPTEDLEEEEVVETPSVEEVKHPVEPPEYHEEDEEMGEVDQNYKLGSELKINALKDDMKEIVRKNPKFGSVKKLNEMLSKPENEMGKHKGRMMMRKEEEVSLMEKRDYYEIRGYEGEYMPKEADLGFFKSPQVSFNLALDQVKILVMKGYRLTNNRTGDMIRKRNVDEYIAKWSKDKNPIISNKVYY